VVYFDKSDSQLECDEDGDKAPKKRSFKKKANATNNNEFELGPDTAPALTHPRDEQVRTIVHHTCTHTSHQFVSTEEEIVAIAMPIEQEGELG